ncbi:hypothetical protein D9O40_06690 [Clostridium autoethanogenum]|uniref:Uncharacterized protein n=1 Tax=Clostridium autoethanogenum TaxID=84023 RepID=A0A3M0T5J1_9CLOT|nr:hypothetical protein [Clostridium autoethanogenum]RMD02318.1 hypothetical protein D9O40_06690 [Clostridium autoethanogenum]
MGEEKVKVMEIIKARNDMLQKEKELYIGCVEKINMNTRELLKNDFGTTLVNNCAKDIAGEVVRRYFDMGDYYITVDQMFERIVHFSYDNETDLLNADDNIRKAFYNMEDSSSTSATLKKITKECQDAQKKLFEGEREKDSLDRKGKKDYRVSKVTENGEIYDELTGQKGDTHTVIKNGKECLVSDLHADHIQARESATYNKDYIREDKVEELRKFYNSADNMQMIHASANTSKSDVRVCEVNGKIEYLQSKEIDSRSKKDKIVDITYKATAEQLADATVTQWEKETKSGNKMKALKDKGYLDENGKVKKSVKKELEHNIRSSQNKESTEILKAANYKNIAKDAVSESKKSVKKIISGQVIYYVLPPLVFETQTILKRKDITIDTFLDELKKAGSRVRKYVISKIGKIFENVTNSSMSKFIKTFFDIIIEMVKATVKKLVKIIKEVVMSLVNCVKILCDGKSTASQKADAITKTLSVSINTVVMELLFEYLQKQLGLPEMLMEPLQIIVTIISTNIIMLVLQKLDLFDVQYGLLISNMEKVFDEANEEYLNESNILFENNSEEINRYMNNIKAHMQEIQESISKVDINKEEITPYLEKLNELFDMEINFNSEWNEFIEAV